MKNFPKQRLAYSAKTKDNYQWAKDVMDNLLLDYAADETIINPYKSDYDRMLSNYQLYNNQLNQADFERECNPYGLDINELKDEVQPYNKTYNKIQVLLGEELRRPFDFKVVLTNPDGIKSKLAMQDEMFKNYIYQQIQATLEELEVNVEEDLFDPDLAMPPAQIQLYMNTKYLDAREILASKLLKYLIRANSLMQVKNDTFKHALLSGSEFGYITTLNGEPTIIPVNPLGMFYYKSPETKYIQDGVYAGYRTYLPAADVLDQYAQHLKEEDIKKIDSTREGSLNSTASHINKQMVYHESDYWKQNFESPVYTEGSYMSNSSPSFDWLVQHVEWRSQKKVGFLTYINQYGDEQEDIVSEDFEVPDYAQKVSMTEAYNRRVTYHVWQDLQQVTYKLSWGWIPEIWEGTRIGEDIYCRMGPKEYQFRSLDNPFRVKLGYHGLVYSSMNASPIALMDRMKPFQYLYFIVMHKLKKLIAQDKGTIFHFDVSMVDPKIGLEKTLYYLTSMNIDFYNPLQNFTAEGGYQRSKVTGATDMSTARHIANYIGILDTLDYQISDVAGVSKSREGQTSPNEAVTNSQTNIQMSSIITEIYFDAHNKLWEKMLESLMETAQSCYKNKSMTKQFILDDLSLATLTFLPGELENASFGLFVINGGKEQYIFDTLMQWGQTLLQNDKAKFSDIITMLETESTESLKNQIIQSEKNSDERESQMQQQQMEAQQQMQQAQQAFELEKQARDHANKVQLAEIDVFKFQMDQDIDDNGIPDPLEVEKFKADIKLKDRKLNIEEKKLAQNDKKMAQDAKIKEEELKIKRKQANKPKA